MRAIQSLLLWAFLGLVSTGANAGYFGDIDFSDAGHVSVSAFEYYDEDLHADKIRGNTAYNVCSQWPNAAGWCVDADADTRGPFFQGGAGDGDGGAGGGGGGPGDSGGGPGAGGGGGGPGDSGGSSGPGNSDGDGGPGAGSEGGPGGGPDGAGGPGQGGGNGK